jgi:hypothetical protein
LPCSGSSLSEPASEGSLRVPVIAFALVVIVVFVFFPAALIFIFVFLIFIWLSSQKNIDSYQMGRKV